MQRLMSATAALVMTIWLMVPSMANAQTGGGDGRFEVTVTNLTREQTFTPVFVASHAPGLRLFEVGRPAIREVEIVAEEGDVDPLLALARNPAVLEATFTGAPPAGFVGPGQSRTLTVRTRAGFENITVIAMLIPTNDAFFGLSDVAGPASGAMMFMSPAYDSGTERNDELCSSIPGPNFAECNGPGGGGQPTGGEEGYVHIHAGIHGIGNLIASRRDWRNPVARIVIRRVP